MATRHEDSELPAPATGALEEFDTQSAQLLDAIAGRLDSKTLTESLDLRPSFAKLEGAIENCRPEHPALPPNLQTFLLLVRHAQNLFVSMDHAIQPDVAANTTPNPLPQPAR